MSSKVLESVSVIDAREDLCQSVYHLPIEPMFSGTKRQITFGPFPSRTRAKNNHSKFRTTHLLETALTMLGLSSLISLASGIPTLDTYS